MAVIFGRQVNSILLKNNFQNLNHTLTLASQGVKNKQDARNWVIKRTENHNKLINLKVAISF